MTRRQAANPLIVACPKCDARIGEPCFNLQTNRKTLYPHDARRKKAVWFTRLNLGVLDD